MSAAGALGCAWALGAGPVGLLLSIAAWATTWILGRATAPYGNLGAALILLVTVPTGPSWLALAGAATTAVLAVVPFFLSLGRGWPSRRALAIAAAATVTPVALSLTAPGAALLTSDLGTGAWVAALAAGALAFGSLLAAPGWGGGSRLD